MIIVGAGIAGVAASILISRKVANLSYKVFEKQETVVCNSGERVYGQTKLIQIQGGTWAQNRYPGVRCDVPAHSYRK